MAGNSVYGIDERRGNGKVEAGVLYEVPVGERGTQHTEKTCEYGTIGPNEEVIFITMTIEV